MCLPLPSVKSAAFPSEFWRQATGKSVTFGLVLWEIDAAKAEDLMSSTETDAQSLYSKPY